MNKYLKEAGNIHLSYYLEAADKLGIEYEVLVHSLLAKFKTTNHHWFIINTVNPLINAPSKTIATRKNLTNLILKNAGIPVPIQKELKTENEAVEFLNEFKDIVLKPKQSLGGKGVSIKPKNEQETLLAFQNAFQYDQSKSRNKVLGEKYAGGENYRLLTLGEKVIGVVKRGKPRVVGDGLSNIENLIKNTNPKIPLDNETLKVLQEQNLDFTSIPDSNKTIICRHNTNMSQGGLTEEYSQYMHPYYEEIARKVLQALDLKFGGIDLIVEDISKPSKYVVNEVNYNPGLRIHYQVNQGKKVKVAIPIIQYIKNHYENTNFTGN